MNKAIISGRTTADIELRTTNAGTSVANCTVAVDRRDKEKNTDFIKVTAWGKTAELLSKYVHKGDKVGVIGRIQTGSYEKDGKRVYTTDVVAEEIEFLESKRREEETGVTDGLPAEEFMQVDDSELPFN